MPRPSVSPRLSFFSTILLLLICSPNQTWAWGRAGHQIVALIAESRLTPRAKESVESILGPNKDFVEEADWADRIKGYRPETKPWHYIDLPVSKDITSADFPDYCVDDACVVRQIERAVTLLKNPSANPNEKRDALRFLTHFVGDVHMPLHCAEDNRDEGGNKKRVWVSRHKTNLHTYWDRLLREKDLKNIQSEARRLEEEFSPTQMKAWGGGDPDSWAFESYRIAKMSIYPDFQERVVEEGRKSITLGKDYRMKFQPIVDQQLVKAGIRLAGLLNEIYK